MTVGEKIQKLVEEINHSGVFLRGFIAEQVLIEVCKVSEQERPATISINGESATTVFERGNRIELLEEKTILDNIRKEQSQ